MKYAILNQSNLPVAFYDDEINSSIPNGAVQLTDSQWREFINNPGRRAWDHGGNAVIPYTPPFDLGAAKEQKKQLIVKAFESATNQPVTDASGVAWIGGKKSALDYDAAKRFAELAGQSTVDFDDDAGNAHTLTIAEAGAVILLVGGDYLTKRAARKALIAQVDALPATATQADLDAIQVVF